MKNFITFLILILSTAPALSKGAVSGSSLIQDELLDGNYIQKIPINKIQMSPITDELLNPKMYGNAPFRLGVYTNKYKNIPITDDLVDRDFITNSGNSQIIKPEIPDDYFIEKITDTSKVRKIKPKTRYDFTKKQIPVRVRIANHLKSTKGTLEGSDIPFLAEHDFEINGKKFKKGTTVLGRVETISDSDKMGVPECIQIDNFYIPDENINLYGSVSKTGANRSIWVYPLYQAGNICLYVAGFAFVPIHGGRVKLKPEETFTLFYETP